MGILTAHKPRGLQPMSKMALTTEEGMELEFAWTSVYCTAGDNMDPQSALTVAARRRSCTGLYGPAVPLRRCWAALKGGLSADEIAAAHDAMLERMDAEFGTLRRLEGLVATAEATFAHAAAAKEMDPSATADAEAAEAEAAENAQVPTPSGLSQGCRVGFPPEYLRARCRRRGGH